MKRQSMDEYVEERKMAKAYIKPKVLTAPPLPATKECRYIEPMPAGLKDNHIKWREKPLEQAKKKAKPKAAPKPKKPKAPKYVVEKQGKYRKWSFEQKEDIVRRHDSGERWETIAEDYDTTRESVRAVWSRWTGRK